MAATASANASKHRKKCTDSRRRPAQQIELFGDEQRGALTHIPAWQDLPATTRAVLTSLMARLVLDHADTSPIGGGRP